MTIEMDDSQVIIRDHVVTDVAVIAEFRVAIETGKSPSEFLNQVLSIGAQVVAIGSASVSTEKLEASVTQAKQAMTEAAKGVGESIVQELGSVVAVDGKLMTGFNEIMDDFRKSIESLTADEDSPVRSAIMKSMAEVRAKFEGDVAKFSETQRKDLATMLDPKDPTSPLRTLMDKVDSIIVQVEKVQEAQTREIAVIGALESGVFGGMAYEDAALQMLQQIAAAAGDECEQTGALPGRVSRSKKGDAVIDVKVGPNIYTRLVMEAKNKKLTKANWELERDESKENRGASGFIGLCKHAGQMPTGGRILILDQSSIVVAYDPEVDDLQILYLIYHIIRLHSLSGTGEIGEMNIADINQLLEQAVRNLKGFDSIKKHANSIRTSADKIKLEAEEIASAIREDLETARSMIVTNLEPSALETSAQRALSSGGE